MPCYRLSMRQPRHPRQPRKREGENGRPARNVDVAPGIPRGGGAGAPAWRLVVGPIPRRPDPATLYVSLDKTGRPRLRGVSPLAGCSEADRIKVYVAVLERLALLGDARAASDLLRHYRWTVEMRTGKAAQRTITEHRGEVRVVNDLAGRKPVVDITQSYRTLGGAQAKAAAQLKSGGDGTPTIPGAHPAPPGSPSGTSSP